MKKKLTKEVKNMQNENSKHRALRKKLKKRTHIQNGKTFHVHELEDNIVKISILLNVI